MKENQKKTAHYVDNKKFSEAVIEYVAEVKKAKENEEIDLPQVPEYIAKCFLKIAEGLSRRPNFIRYTYRDEMVMDAVENCLRAILNYDPDAPTVAGKPNAFGYFTKIISFAFIRRIQKENKQINIKNKFLEESGIENFLTPVENEELSAAGITNFVGDLKNKVARNNE